MNEIERGEGKPPGPVYWVGTAAIGAVAIACLFAGCGARGRPASRATEEQFKLVAIDGRTLPCVVGPERGHPEVREGRFTLHSDGTCESDIAFAVGGAEKKRTVRADYVRDGDLLTMRWQGAGTTMGRMVGDVFAMTNEAAVFLYRRQTGTGSQP